MSTDKNPERQAKIEEAEKKAAEEKAEQVRLHCAQEQIAQQEYVRPWARGPVPLRPEGTVCSVCGHPFQWLDVMDDGAPLWYAKHNVWAHRRCFEQGEHEVCTMQRSF